jgi:hypothetical protein
MFAKAREPQVGAVPTGRDQYVTVVIECDITRLVLMSFQWRMQQSASVSVPEENQFLLAGDGDGGVARMPCHLAQRL